MTTGENIHFANISATTAPFVVKGGVYRVNVVATFGGGSVKLQTLGPDGSTYLDLQSAFDKTADDSEIDLVVSSFVANGSKDFFLSPGQYRLTIATASAVYADVTLVPQT